MSVIGALLGVLLGVGFGWAVVTAMQEVFGVFAVSYGQLGLFLVLAVVCGTLAAVFPARRAAKASVVSVLAEE